MKHALIIITSIFCLSALMCAPQIHAQDYILVGGMVRPNPEAIRNNYDLVLEKIRELRLEYAETKNTEVKKTLNEYISIARGLQKKRIAERATEETPATSEENTPSPEVQSAGPRNETATYFSVHDNGRKMANGEIFRNEKMVVAHKNLPVGTEIKIKSLVTGNEFIGTVQDNGTGKDPDAEVVLSKTALVEKLFNNNWDVLYDIQEKSTPVEITVLEEDEKEEEKEIQKSIPRPSESSLIRVRKEIRALEKEYEKTGNESTKEQLARLYEKNEKLRSIQRNLLQARRAEQKPYQTGYATYYSARFNGRRTANGETFSNQELTAAHRTLPFGTRIRVVNTDTKKEVIVRINDRGPYSSSNRIVDLSKEAFAQMYGGDWANLSRGIAPVEIYIMEENQL